MTETMTLSAALDECLGWYEALRRFGFTPDEIFLSCEPARVWMTVVAQERTVHLSASSCAIPTTPERELRAAWEAKAHEWNTGNDDLRMEIFHRSRAFQGGLGTVLAVTSTGLRLPVANRGELTEVVAVKKVTRA